MLFKSQMLFRWWPKPKWIKHIAAQVGSEHPSSWNVTLYLQFKSSFSFFFSPQSATFPIKVFWNQFDPNATIKWSTKVQKSVSSKALREEHQLWRLQHSISHKLIWNFLLWPFDGSHMTRESPPHLYSTFSTPMFLLPYQHKLWFIT